LGLVLISDLGFKYPASYGHDVPWPTHAKKIKVKGQFFVQKIQWKQTDRPDGKHYLFR